MAVIFYTSQKITDLGGVIMSKPGRNDPCQCGSGKKYKRCCLEKDSMGERVRVPGYNSHDLSSLGIKLHGAFADAFQCEEGYASRSCETEAYDPNAVPDPDVWDAIETQEKYDLVLAWHHAGKMIEEDMNAHVAIHCVVEDQVIDDRTPEVREAILRLMGRGLTRHSAIHAIAALMMPELFGLPESVQAPTKSAYRQALKQLDSRDWIHRV